MRLTRTFYHLTRADFLERVRRYGFLCVIAITVAAGYLFVPQQGASYLVLQLGLKRGLYNSAWIGLMFGLIAAMHLPLYGFYLVNNAVDRDRQSGVGQVIATTPTPKSVYVLGKWLSNMAVLGMVLGVMTFMAALMQLVRAEDTALKLGALVFPIWLMGLPVLALAAATAVLFENISFLRRGLGNVVYFFIWLGVLIATLNGSFDKITHLAQPGNDILGFTRSMADIQHQLLAIDPDANIGSGLIVTLRNRQASTFIWQGVDWTFSMVLERMLWVGLALAIAWSSALPFDRFDPALRKRLPSTRQWFSRQREWMVRMLRGETANHIVPTGELHATAPTYLKTAMLTKQRGRFFRVLAAELKLMLKGHSLLWYAGAFGLILACLLSPFKDVQQYVLPIVWLWPVLVWSQLGTREHRFNTEQMVFPVPHPIRRQLPALWLAGVLFTMLASSGLCLRFVLLREWTSVLSWFVGVLFTVALALVLGVWTGSNRAFELFYPLMWYLGVINKVPVFDYAGVTAGRWAVHTPVVYAGLTIGLYSLAVVGRWRTLQR